MLTEACCSPVSLMRRILCEKAVAGGRAGKQEDAGSDATSTIIHVPIQQGLDVMK